MIRLASDFGLNSFYAFQAFFLQICWAGDLFEAGESKIFKISVWSLESSVWNVTVWELGLEGNIQILFQVEVSDFAQLMSVKWE